MFFDNLRDPAPVHYNILISIIFCLYLFLSVILYLALMRAPQHHPPPPPHLYPIACMLLGNIYLFTAYIVSERLFHGCCRRWRRWQRHTNTCESREIEMTVEPVRVRQINAKYMFMYIKCMLFRCVHRNGSSRGY